MNSRPLGPGSGRRFFNRTGRLHVLVWCVLALAAGVFPARAQLAITEIMSSPAIICGGVTTTNSDFWELTNFGTTNIDLTGYQWNDGPFDGPVLLDNAVLIKDVWIAPGESIVFFRPSTGIPDAAAFRAWWGEANLSPSLQLVRYPASHGFSSAGERLQLWDASGSVVDQASFPAVEQSGMTLTYETNCGRFEELSASGVCGAFQAAGCSDIGSPGTNACGPVRLSITQQPFSQSVDAGMNVTLVVRACGLPRPQFKWYRNGELVPNEQTGGSVAPSLVNLAGCGLAWTTVTEASDLIIPVAEPNHAGEYYVELSNGMETLRSATITLTINTNHAPPRVECPPSEFCSVPALDGPPTRLTVAPGQTTTFEAPVRGYPLPTFQWSWSADGESFTILTGETKRVLIVPNAQPANGGTYRVRATNPLGSTNADATLVVKPKARLKITEAMVQSCNQTSDLDWWELTNTGDEPVNLCGYRWDDQPGLIGGGPTISDAVIVRAGESIILLQNHFPEQFVQRWGATNLPPGLQFVTYVANGFNAVDGDEINLWNPAATDDFDQIDSVSFGTTRTSGLTFWFDAEACPVSETELGSAVTLPNECGAFPSVEGCDIGSPGWTRWSPPGLTSIWRTGSTVALEWRAQPGSTCMLQCADRLEANPGTTTWSDLGTYTFSSAVCRAQDNTPGAGGQRFYRVKMISPASCPCPIEEF